ncbi:pseudouridine synthase [Fragilariopsis cylindrus CCMP1102]|uniref:Pseudouridine synthase n=1 Tax=Fragilariopsis cylindrus CCMP1102 TaxID=635003 RepID=A0A1E7EPP7_9STRA|nr:pseudouridine synthase [Fragilariopsis cylindrus CCMP1102]|eukprot:OEU07845.1 pseudouridine synthase [Fragilariopsis cylindrus CCMP1102]
MKATITSSIVASSLLVVITIIITLYHVSAFVGVPSSSRAAGAGAGLLTIKNDRRWCRLEKLAATGGKKRISGEEIRIRNLQQLDKLRIRDRQSKKISGDELKIIFEDKWLICVDKPSGVLCVPSEEDIPTLAQTVFETVNHRQSSLDRMVVHRLGMDTSGLVIFAKTMKILRELNTLFRTRKIVRKYEVLVCGHISDDTGTINLPIMRDYHQRALLNFDGKIVGKKLLEAPKASQTKYEVIGRETFLDTDLPVTRLLLTSITGRTHQLNVHMAAFGHPIVGDRVYGLDGDALPNGGLDYSESLSDNTSSASIELQRAIGTAATTAGCNMCAHAKFLSFNHPMRSPDDEPLLFESKAPF